LLARFSPVKQKAGDYPAWIGHKFYATSFYLDLHAFTGCVSIKVVAKAE
jgi:hypothetical protein